MKVFVLITKGCGTNAKLSRIKINFTNFTQQTELKRVKLVEHGPAKSVTHINDLKELFPDVDIHHL